jgi:hypothetical protein
MSYEMERQSRLEASHQRPQTVLQATPSFFSSSPGGEVNSPFNT